MFKQLSSLSLPISSTTTTSPSSPVPLSGSSAPFSSMSSMPPLHFMAENDPIPLAPVPLSPSSITLSLAWGSRIINTPCTPTQINLAGVKRKSTPPPSILVPSSSSSPFPYTNTAAALSPLREGQSPLNQQDEEGNTPLMQAILRNDIDKAATLITLSADPNIQNKRGDTSLMLAISQGHLSLATQLIHHPSIKILLANTQQETAFSYLNTFPGSNRFIHTAIETLIAKEISKNLINLPWQNTTFFCAIVAKKNLAAIQVLLQRGADPNIPNPYGNTPLMVAVQQGYMPGVTTLLPITHNLNQQNYKGDTMLTLAIQLGHLSIASELVSYSINLFLINHAQQNAFMLLAQQGYYQSSQHLVLAKKMLIAAVQNFPFILNSKIDKSHTLTALAAMLGEILPLRVLIARNADFTLPNHQGNTPLMLAITHGHVEEAQLLLSFYNDVDAQNQNGDSALMLAIRLGYTSIAHMLVTRASRANVFLYNKQGDTAFSLLLRNRLSYTKQEFFLATTMLTWAVEAVSSDKIDCKIDGRNTLLCLAITLVNISAVMQLLNKGANLNIPNNDGDTPIMLAIKQKQLEMTYFLLSQHPNLSWQNQQRKTAYSLALENRWGFLSF